MVCVGRQDGFFRMTRLHTSGACLLLVWKRSGRMERTHELIDAVAKPAHLAPTTVRRLVIERSDMPQHDGSKERRSASTSLEGGLMEGCRDRNKPRQRIIRIPHSAFSRITDGAHHRHVGCSLR